MTNIDRWPEAFQDGIPKAGGRWSWNRRAITVKSPMVSGECAVLFDDGMKTTWIPKDFAYDSIAFLGFSDSAPVNQGAAAPQKPVEVCRACCSKPATVYWMPTRSPVCAVCDRERGKPEWVREPIGSPAPIVAPPLSLKPAVQQEGLTIPPQAGTRHEFWETFAQAEEGGQNYKSARESRAKAQAVLAADLAYDLEADAIREGRTVLKAALKEMGQGDRRCFELRGLREFEAIGPETHALYFWWRKP